MKKAVKNCLIKNRAAVIILMAALVINFVVFKLYGIMTEPLFYAGALVFAAGLILLTIDFCRELARQKKRDAVLISPVTQWHELPTPESEAERELYEIISALSRRSGELQEEYDRQLCEARDYYTDWVHQIKIPISVMRLILSEDTEANREIRAELIRTEQYADMALQYARLQSSVNDLVIQEYSLDAIVRETLRRFAPLFIKQRLKLDFEPGGKTTVTDKKWLGCILEQLISNALKYTESGGVTIRCTEKSISVTDTGRGIDPSELPRIFDRGYTGTAGRTDTRATGLGLYLASRAAQKLNCRITAESEPGRGSRFTILLP